MVKGFRPPPTRRLPSPRDVGRADRHSFLVTVSASFHSSRDEGPHRGSISYYKPVSISRGRRPRTEGALACCSDHVGVQVFVNRPLRQEEGRGQFSPWMVPGFCTDPPGSGESHLCQHHPCQLAVTRPAWNGSLTGSCAHWVSATTAQSRLWGPESASWPYAGATCLLMGEFLGCKDV